MYDRFGETVLEKAMQILSRNKILAVSSSVEETTYEKNEEIAKLSPWVLPVFGIHPQNALEYEDKLDSMTPYLDRAVMYSEIGLDHSFVKDTSTYPLQKKLLEFFFEAARKKNKIVILHINGAEEEALELIRQFSLSKVVVHGYEGPLDIFQRLVELNAHFSIGGNAIMEEWKRYNPLYNEIQTIVKEIPSDLLLLETDGPCRIAPDSETRRMPNYLNKIVERVTEIRKVPQEELTTEVQKNFLELIKDDERLKKYSVLLQEN